VYLNFMRLPELAKRVKELENALVKVQDVKAATNEHG